MLQICKLTDPTRHLRPNTPRLARALLVDAEGQTSGIWNRPAHSDLVLDEPQQRIVATIVEGINRSLEYLASGIAKAADQIRKRTPVAVTAAALVLDARNEVAAIQGAFESRLDAVLQNLKLAERRLRAFQVDHDLRHRDAVYAATYVWPVGILSILVAVEALVNATLFMNASNSGYVGGAALALLFSFINVALGFLTGLFGLRSLIHRDWMVTAVGAAITTLGAAAGLWWAWSVASYRTAIETQPDIPFAWTLVPAFAGPITVEAVALLVLSVLFCVAAAGHGRGGRDGFTDVYWGYASVHRARVRALRSWDDGIAAYRSKARRVVRSSLRSMLRSRKSEARGLRQAQLIFGKVGVLRTTLLNIVHEWLAAARRLLERYRGANRDVRTEPQPDYFSTLPDFDRLTRPMPPLDELESVLADAVTRCSTNERERQLAEQQLAGVIPPEPARWSRDLNTIIGADALAETGDASHEQLAQAASRNLRLVPTESVS